MRQKIFTPYLGAQILIRRCPFEELVDLRHAVLRQGMPREAAVFEGDAAPTSRHYGAFMGPAAVCCATLHQSAWDEHPAWQLRGMATAPEFQRKGVGRALMGFVEEDLAEQRPVLHLWCNARIPAVEFYKQMGWSVKSETFEIPTAGPHVKMVRHLTEKPF